MFRLLPLRRDSETEGGDALLPTSACLIWGLCKQLCSVLARGRGQHAALHGASGTAKQRSCTIIYIS